MTERLYLKDAYCKRFTAVVTGCEVLDGKFGIELDQTAFFPEGGGQPADRGTMNGIPVTDVQQKGNRVIHYLETELQVGEKVSCEIDWELRYTRMQGHTGEHIFSGIVHSLYQYDNVGFHLNDKMITMDFNGSLSSEDIKIIEIKSNEAIYQNADVVAYYPTRDELETLEFRSKKELTEDLRIVAIGEDIDCCACCAPHVAKTGEVGIIKVIDFYSFKQGTRVEMLAGKTALLDFIDMNLRVKEIMKATSSPRNAIVDAVREKVSALQELRFENQKLSKLLAYSELELCEAGDAVYSVAANLSFDELRYCANRLLEKEYNSCILLSKTEGEYLYVISSKSIDVRPIVKELNERFAGKGGGKSEYSQGKISSGSEEEIKEFIVTILGK